MTTSAKGGVQFAEIQKQIYDKQLREASDDHTSVVPIDLIRRISTYPQTKKIVKKEESTLDDGRGASYKTLLAVAKHEIKHCHLSSALTTLNKVS